MMLPPAESKPADAEEPERVERADRFAWLLGPDESEGPGRFHPQQLEAACTFMLRNWQALPVMAPKFLHWIGDEYSQTPEVERIRDATAAVRALARVQALLGNRFTNELDRHAIPYVLMKGSAAVFAVYSEPDLRSGLDIDIGVPRRYIRRAERLARNQGFVAAAFDADNRHVYRVSDYEKRCVEAQHYELACLNRRQVVRGLSAEDDAAIRRSIPIPRAWHETKDGQLACYVTLDLHHGISLDIEVDEMVASGRKETRHGYTALIPQPEWMMLQLIFKIYWEGVHRYRMRGLYQYADLVRLVGQIHGPVASRFFDLLNRYELQAGAYYILRRVEKAFGLQLGPELREFLTEASIPPTHRSPNEVNDMGDMWPRLWGYR